MRVRVSELNQVFVECVLSSNHTHTHTHTHTRVATKRKGLYLMTPTHVRQLECERRLREDVLVVCGLCCKDESSQCHVHNDCAGQTRENKGTVAR